MINVTVWNEFYNEKNSENVALVYPDGIHSAIAQFLGEDKDIKVRTSTLEDEEQGLSDEILKNTDVLIWWAHSLHGYVRDDLAEKVRDRVLSGMGLIVLHSGHLCKPFKLLMGTSCTLNWRDNDRERIWCCNPSHPIAFGLPAHFELESEEMYGEFFDIPKPDDIIFLGWFKGGEVFRSGCTFNRGYGKIFYFQPGHEEFPTYKNINIQKVITNAVKWAKSDVTRQDFECPNPEALEV